MYTIAEFGKLIGVSVQTLRVWHTNGKLVPESITVGGQRRYSEAQVRDYLSSSKLSVAYCSEEESSLMQEYLASCQSESLLIVDDLGKLVNLICGRRVITLKLYSQKSLEGFKLLSFICKKFDVELTTIRGTDVDIGEGGDD